MSPSGSRGRAPRLFACVRSDPSPLETDELTPELARRVSSVDLLTFTQAAPEAAQHALACLLDSVIRLPQ